MPEPVKKLIIDFAAKSDIGLVRTENQDSFGKFPYDNTNLYASKGQLFIVADGMGGHKGGKEASSIAVETINNEFFNSPDEVPVAVKEAMEKANNAIFSQSSNSTEFGRMGTTCSVLVLKDEEGIIGHVGDSRIYKIENNNIEQLTDDHTKVLEMLKQGILTPEEAANYPSKSVLARALGVDEKVKVDIIKNIKLNNGQSYIMCSDGLAKVSKEEILNIVSNNSPSDACKILVEMANERGGKDNVTVIIVNVNQDRAVNIQTAEDTRKKLKEVNETRTKKGKGVRLTVLILFLVALIFLAYQYKDRIFSANPDSALPPEIKQSEDTSRNVEPIYGTDESDKKLLDKAEKFLKTRNYENALLIYKSILDAQPMHQAALKGINEIASAYISSGDVLMEEKNFGEALKYYKKAEAVQPENQKIKSLIRICTNQIGYREGDSDTSGSDVQYQTATNITAEAFDKPGWNYPGINKNEFTIKSNELSFTNTLSEKFVIYNKDLLDVTIAVNIEIDYNNSVIGLIIGYESPSDYYIFKYSDKGSYTLLRIKNDNPEKLLVIPPKDSGLSGIRKMKIIYSDNLVSLYDQSGLISTYKSAEEISGKAGIYVDKNSSVKFINISLTGKTKLD